MYPFSIHKYGLAESNIIYKNEMYTFTYKKWVQLYKKIKCFFFYIQKFAGRHYTWKYIHFRCKNQGYHCL